MITMLALLETNPIPTHVPLQSPPSFNNFTCCQIFLFQFVHGKSCPIR